ncbi:MAG: Asp-tRNA(Asn)/Glu-tRNA(Gln) amidotransferase subunit GatC [Clostridia bacterium]|nr:Asp-tRNA(Asn)/Glu-tRNA(Gln) amidotransferase subunit GatC [Clostridia bacterium]
MISKEEVIKLAKLSRLAYTDEEIDKYQTELNSIVGYAERINSIDVSSVKPSATISDMTNVLREDEVKPSLTREEVLANAKDKEYGCFYVTKVVE